MMAVKSLALALAAGAHLASAHFGLVYPPWRTDSLNSKDPSISQWTYPCAGVPANITGNNVTDWPLDGGSLKLGLHHAWEYIFINLGLAANAAGDVTNFNISLTPQFLNSSGKGDLCIPQLKLPAAFKPAEGARASIQVVTVGAEGSALYNCADIRFTANATVLKGDACPANPNITYYPVKQQTANGTLADGSGSGSSSTGGNSSAGGGKSAGSLAGVDKTALASVVGLTAALVYGLGF